MQILTLCLMFLATIFLSCSSSTKPESIFIKNAGKISIGFFERYRFSGGFFVLIEEEMPDNWVIKNISDKPIVGRKNQQQEVLYVSKSLDDIQPYYEDYKVVDGALDCSSCRSNTYNPRYSKLVAGISVLGYGVDIRKIGKIIEQTNLLAEIKECEKLQSDLRNSIKKIKVEPQIVDETGFYKGENIVNISEPYISGLEDCPINMEQVVYSIKIKPSYSDFVIYIEPTSYDNIKYNPSEEYLLKPVVKVISKTFNEVFPNDIFEDQNLAIKLNKISVNNSGDIEVALDCYNKQDKYITIEAISIYIIYINDSIFTPVIGNFDLPPKSSKDSIQLKLSREIGDKEIFKRAYKLIKRDFTKESAEKTSIILGVSTKYRIDAFQNTLYKSNQYKLSAILKDR